MAWEKVRQAKVPPDQEAPVAAGVAAIRTLADLRAAVEALAPDCHCHSGLYCEPDDYGECYLIDRALVLAIIDGEVA